MKKERRIFSLIILIITFIFFYTPIITLLIYSFNSSKSMHWNGFSLKWYKELFTNSGEIWKAFFNSITIAITSALFSTIIGTIAAIGLKWHSLKNKNVIQKISYVSLVMPDIIVGVSLLILFGVLKMRLGLFTIFIAHTTFNIPYVLFIALSAMEDIDYSLIEASYDLGATEIQALTKVMMPVLKPAIISSILMTVTLSIDDFVITFFVSGPGSTTLPLQIYSMIRFGVSPVINALSVVMIFGTIILAISTRRFFKYLF
ncbi:ABC transporter permease [Oceanotoga sp. DSM 15011]|uniref:ABC transporter permease n=1 Tax=Oceanotoga TaxID=1255275 RepID=UPI0021F41D35|nr:MULTISPECIES: ABC transporter permease [Oceanotoga]MDO7977697.1 ABC transporter permease [Oceanotoga teriensis]UYO99651.1 ABC transporter permease [Oceanotoga sp. DSM 15011]